MIIIILEVCILIYLFNNIRILQYQGLMDHLNLRENSDNKQVGKIVILPSTFPGSPRNMIQKYQDSMTIAYHFGQPDLFLTMTSKLARN